MEPLIEEAKVWLSKQFYTVGYNSFGVRVGQERFRVFSCREIFHRYLAREKQPLQNIFYFCPEEFCLKTFTGFWKELESRLMPKQEPRSEIVFFDYKPASSEELNPVILMKTSPWWNRNNFRRALFTAFIKTYGTYGDFETVKDFQFFIDTSPNPRYFDSIVLANVLNGHSLLKKPIAPTYLFSKLRHYPHLTKQPKSYVQT